MHRCRAQTAAWMCGSFSAKSATLLVHGASLRKCSAAVVLCVCTYTSHMTLLMSRHEIRNFTHTRCRLLLLLLIITVPIRRRPGGFRSLAVEDRCGSHQHHHYCHNSAGCWMEDGALHHVCTIILFTRLQYVVLSPLSVWPHVSHVVRSSVVSRMPAN